MTKFFVMINIYDFKIAHPETFKQLSVRDLLFVYYRCPQAEKLMQLYNHYNLIVFTLGGERIIHLGEKSWTASKDTSVFQSKTAFVQELTETVDWEVLAFYIPDEFLKQFANEFRDQLAIQKVPAISGKIMFEINLNDAIRTYFYSMIPYFTQKLPPSEKLLELKFKELLLNILTNPSNKELLAYIINLSDNFKKPIWQVMENNYMYNLKISEFAQISSRSLSSFKKEFYECYQTTPGRWLTEKRLQHAKMLLNTSNLAVSEIAFNSGFENVSHFSRIFKEKHGCSPLQFKKKPIEIS
jgi:AraC-like DNA-binding protein